MSTFSQEVRTALISVFEKQDAQRAARKAAVMAKKATPEYQAARKAELEAWKADRKAVLEAREAARQQRLNCKS
jgi:hypothetical protein